MAALIKLSLCMIVRDEEENLPRCLESVRGLVDEIVVVDTGSRDGTVQVARQYGARVIPAPWQEDFAAARNRGLDQAAGEWVLVLDADEELGPEGREALPGLLACPEVEGYLVRVVNLLGEAPNPPQEETPGLRLFRNRPEYRFTGALHEQIAPSILAARPQARLEPSGLRILHRGYLPEVRQRWGKHRRNLGILERMRAEAPDDPFILYLLGVEHLAEGEAGAALAYLEEACRLAPPDRAWRPKLVKSRAAALAEEGRWADLLACLGPELDRYPDYTDLHYLAGLAAQGLGRHQEAAAAFRRCLALGPAPSPPYGSVDPAAGGARAWCALGESLRALGDWPGAFGAYTQAVRAAPGWLEPLLGLAGLLGERTDGAGLRRLLEALVPPVSPASRVLIARLLIHVGRYPEALPYLEAACAGAEAPAEWLRLRDECRARCGGAGPGPEGGSALCPGP